MTITLYHATDEAVRLLDQRVMLCSALDSADSPESRRAHGLRMKDYITKYGLWSPKCECFRDEMGIAELYNHIELSTDMHNALGCLERPRTHPIVLELELADCDASMPFEFKGAQSSLCRTRLVAGWLDLKPVLRCVYYMKPQQSGPLVHAMESYPDAKMHTPKQSHI
jgi:hypothetical protein